MQNILSITADVLYFVRKHKGRPACLPLEKKQTVPLAQEGRATKLRREIEKPRNILCSRRGRPACLPLYLKVVFNLASLDLYSASCRSFIVLSVPTEPTVGA